jgi:hypothetical protein
MMLCCRNRNFLALHDTISIYHVLLLPVLAVVLDISPMYQYPSLLVQHRIRVLENHFASTPQCNLSKGIVWVITRTEACTCDTDINCK